MTTTARAKSSDLAGRLTVDGHELRQRVYFEDTDFSGRVYHARYLQFMERGRTDFLRHKGVHHHELAGQGLVFAVARMEIDFLAAAAIDDILMITTRLARIGGARILLRQQIDCEERPVVRAGVMVALINDAGKPVRLPQALRSTLA